MKAMVVGAIGSVFMWTMVILLCLAVANGFAPGWVGAQTGITDFTSVRLEDALIVTGQSSFTVTDGLEIPSDGSYQPVTAAGAVWTDDIEDGQSAGQLLVIHNVGAQNVVISETSYILLSGDTTLGAADSVTVVWTGARWNEIAQADN